jgi:beta-alanine--pyruvate transaminase
MRALPRIPIALILPGDPHEPERRATPRPPPRPMPPGSTPHWMPYTGNRNFKANPRMMVSAQGAYYTDSRMAQDFRRPLGPVVLRAWAMAAARSPRPWPAGAKLDYSPAFQFGHPLSFELANKIKELTPAGLDYVFFTGSGSEAADTSLKMARAYWRTKGQASKTR